MGALIDMLETIWSWCDAQVKVLPGKGDKVLVTGHVCFATGSVSGVGGQGVGGMPGWWVHGRCCVGVMGE